MLQATKEKIHSPIEEEAKTATEAWDTQKETNNTNNNPTIKTNIKNDDSGNDSDTTVTEATIKTPIKQSKHQFVNYEQPQASSSKSFDDRFAPTSR